MSDSSISKAPCANNEPVLKIDTIDKLNELLRTAGKHDLAAIRQVNLTYNVDGDHLDRELELRTARFLGALPQLQTLQLGRDDLPTSNAMVQLLQQAITEASATSFRELKTTIIQGRDSIPLDEILPLWGLPVEHIEVTVAEPVSWSHKPWPAPNPSLKKLNLEDSTINHSTVEKLLHLSPCLEVFRYDYYCDVDAHPQQWPQDSSLLTAALRQVQSTLSELNLTTTLTTDSEELTIFPVSGQLGPLQEFSRLSKLKAPIATLLGWSPNKLLSLAKVVPPGLTYLGLTECMLLQETSKWHPNLVLKELAAFLSVWRSVTPDLQVMEVWLVEWRYEDIEQTELQKMCKEAQKYGLSLKIYLIEELEGTKSSMNFQWARGYS